MYETRRTIIKNTFDEKCIMIEFSKYRQLFSFDEKTIIFYLIDSFVAMRFFARPITLKEKVLFFLKKRCESSSISLK